MLRSVLDLPDRWADDPLWYLCYIDDGLAGEKVANCLGISHFSQAKESKLIHAIQSEKFLKLMIQNSKRIGMAINARKTKMVCVNVATSAEINTYIEVAGEKIYAEQEMMMLGFKIGRRPDATAHVNYIERRFYSKAWILHHFKQCNSDYKDLLKIYQCYVLPVIEYAVVVYHPLLNDKIRMRLENLQKRALQIIYGFGYSYRKLREKAEVKTLEERKINIVSNFSRKMAIPDRFGPLWFPKKLTDARLRQREKYQIERAKYDRFKFGHLNLMRRLINNDE